MRKVRAIIFTIVFLVLLSGLALADSTVVVNAVDNEITPAEEATFDVVITNNDLEAQGYYIYSLDSGSGWNIDPTPLKDKKFTLGSGKSKTIRMEARPLSILMPKIYYLKFSVESDTGEVYNEALKVYLETDRPMDYLPTLKVDIDVNEKVDPTKLLSVKLFLENRNYLNLTDLTIEIQSDLPEFNKKVMVDLPPLEEKTVEFSIIPNPIQQPKDYTLFFVFSKNGEIVKIKEQKIEIVSLVPEFDKLVVEENVFLKVFSEMIVTNLGNVKNTQKVKLSASIWKAMFTSGVDSEVIDGERYLVWELELAPNESKTFNFVTNYRWIIYILVIILLFAGFYWYVKSPIQVVKTAVTAKSDEETISEIKVTLEVKNLSGKNLKDINITDLVPGIANVEKGLELGTLKPQEIKQAKKHTQVIWALAELDAHEQRLITYKIRTKLNIVGTFSLPRASVTFKKKGRGKGKAYSNVFRLSA